MPRLTIDVNINGRRVYSRDSSGPAPLYVSRQLLNAKDLVSWAKSKGLKGILESDDMHVTEIYSKAPVDWFKMPYDYTDNIGVPPGGPRKMEIFGKPGNEVLVLRFQSRYLERRNAEFRKSGCSTDFPEYSPHVTVSKSPGNVDVGSLAPFYGHLEFGPERFAPLKD